MYALPKRQDRMNLTPVEDMDLQSEVGPTPQGAYYDMML